MQLKSLAVPALHSDDPPCFLARLPHGYYNHETIKRDLAAGGYTASPVITTLAARSQAASCEHPAVACCQGTPLRNEIEARDAWRLADATIIAAEAMTNRFGRAADDVRPTMVPRCRIPPRLMPGVEQMFVRDRHAAYGRQRRRGSPQTAPTSATTAGPRRVRGLIYPSLKNSTALPAQMVSLSSVGTSA
jgi:hypothetical protein